jgi:hypothetical protein
MAVRSSTGAIVALCNNLIAELAGANVSILVNNRSLDMPGEQQVSGDNRSRDAAESVTYVRALAVRTFLYFLSSSFSYLA